MAKARKYTITEIDAMRETIRWSYPSGVSYYQKERSAEIEDRLRTYMQNGTEPEELAEMSKMAREAAYERHKALREYSRKEREKAPPPRVLVTKDDVIDEWYQTCVAKYEGAGVEASELFDGVMGRTLKHFANQRAPDGIHIKQSDMERYLDGKGVKSRCAMSAKRYDGIRHIIHGDVRSGNYGT